jgi:hypothetical protein
MKGETILAGDATRLEEHRRYPGCRVRLTCSLCGWSKDYDPARIIDRLNRLRVSGHTTTLRQVAGRVGWNCPGCRHVKWRAQFAWPDGLEAREIKRLTNLYRN